MKATRNVFKSTLKLSFIVMIGAGFLTSCSKDTCPAYPGAKKYHKKNASWAMSTEKESHHKI